MKQDRLYFTTFLIGTAFLVVFLLHYCKNNYQNNNHEVFHDTIFHTITHFDTFQVLKCDTVILPKKEVKLLYINELDTVIVLKEITDTSEIIRRFSELREYKQQLIDNQEYKASAIIRLQYNEIQNIDFTLIPKEKDIKHCKSIYYSAGMAYGINNNISGLFSVSYKNKFGTFILIEKDPKLGIYVTF